MKRYLPLVTFLFFSALTFIGILYGGASDVFQKAVTICLSCIGIG